MLVVLIIGLGIIVVAVFFLVQGSRRLRRTNAFARRAVVVQARVTDVVTRDVTGPTNFNRLFFPVVEFVLPDGRRVEAETRVGSDPTPARPGDVVRVRYDPRDPQQVELAEGVAQPQNLAGMHILLGVLGIVFGVVVCAFWAFLTVILDVPA